MAHNAKMAADYVRYVNNGDRVLVYLTLSEESYNVAATINGLAMNQISDKLNEDGTHYVAFDYYLSENDGLADGMATFKITGTDFAGNPFEYTEADGTLGSQQYVYIDRTTPVPTNLRFMANGEVKYRNNIRYVNDGDRILVYLTLSEESYNVVATINGLAMNQISDKLNEDGTHYVAFDYYLSENDGLADGMATFKITGEDRAGNPFELTEENGTLASQKWVYIDRTFSTVRFTKLNKYLAVDEMTPVEYNGKLYFAEPVTVSFGDANNIWVYGHNEKEVEEGNPNRKGWAENAKTLGEHTIYVVDIAGNKTSVTFTIVENPELIVENGVMNITDDSLIINDSIYYDETGETTAGNIINASGDIEINGNNKTITMGTTYQPPYMEEWETGYKAPAMTNIFASKNGSVVVNDLTIKGQMSANSLGWYSTPTKKNVLNNVNIIDTEVVSFAGGVANALSIYGNAELINTNIYGTKLSSRDISGFPLYDVVLGQGSNTLIDGGKIGSIYTWWKISATIKNAEIGTIYSNQDKRTTGLIVDEGTTVEKIVVSSYYDSKNDKYYEPKVTIKAGAVVDVLDLSNTEFDDKIIIEEGAVVNTIIN